MSRLGSRGRWWSLVVASTLPLLPTDAHAVGFMSSGVARPTEERIAVALSEQRTAVFTQLVVESDGAEVAVVVPLPAGALLDWASRAFFESLEVASAPRVLGPVGNDTCPGHDEPAVHLAGDEEGSEPLVPIELAILEGGTSVEIWAAARNLTVSEQLSTALSVSTSPHFLVALFSAPRGTSVTAPLRVVEPAPLGELPTMLSVAGSEELRITTFAIGPGRAELSLSPITLDLGELALEAGPQTSNFDDLLFEALAPTTYFVGMASHESLREDISLRSGGPIVRNFSRGYFERASAYGDTTAQNSQCVAQAAAVLGQSARIGTTCPRTQLGIVGGGVGCTDDVVDAGEVDPELLRCGPLADDLAVALSDLEPDEVWLTRTTHLIRPGGAGAQLPITFPGGARLDPSFVASSIDFSECSEGAGGSGGGSSSGPGSGPNGTGSGTTPGDGTTVEVPLYVYDGCSSCGTGTYVIADYVEADADSAPDAYYEGDDCEGDTSGSYSGDSCSGDSVDYYDDGYDVSADACDCSDTGADFADEDCSCDDGFADSCSGESFAEGCDCGGDSACSTAKKRKRPRRINMFVYGALIVIVPVRRWTRRASGPGGHPTRR